MLGVFLSSHILLATSSHLSYRVSGLTTRPLHGSFWLCVISLATQAFTFTTFLLTPPAPIVVFFVLRFICFFFMFGFFFSRRTLSYGIVFRPFQFFLPSSMKICNMSALQLYSDEVTLAIHMLFTALDCISIGRMVALSIQFIFHRLIHCGFPVAADLLDVYFFWLWPELFVPFPYYSFYTDVLVRSSAALLIPFFKHDHMVLYCKWQPAIF